jgi:hypothetical protein
MCGTVLLLRVLPTTSLGLLGCAGLGRRTGAGWGALGLIRRRLCKGRLAADGAQITMVLAILLKQRPQVNRCSFIVLGLQKRLFSGSWVTENRHQRLRNKLYVALHCERSS